MTRVPAIVLLGLALHAAGGCASIVDSATGRFSRALSAGILNQPDPQTVRDGMPAYLLLLDGFISESPDNAELLIAGAELYGSYAGGFVEDEGRSIQLAEQARRYGARALCVTSETLCAAMDAPFELWMEALATARARDLPALYGYSASWATWIQLNAGDWNAIADVPKVEAAMARVVELDPEFRRGWPQLYLGVLTTQLPPAYGGRPEEGRRYFEQAMALSGGRNLMVPVLFAQQYARLVFDRELHDRLLSEALAADPDADDLTLINVLAQQRARRLLDESRDYF